MTRMTILAISALAIIATALLPAVEAAEETVPAPSQPPAQVQEPEGTPRITFDKAEHDFGVLGAKETVKHTFKFRNEGDALLVIDKVKATCGCTGTLLSKKEIAPNEEGSIEVTFRSGLSGGQNKKSIFVHSNDPNNPTAKLHILANIVLPVEVRPRALYWAAEKNQASMRTVQFIYQPDIAIDISGFDFSSSAFTASKRPRDNAESPGYQIDIAYDGSLPVGTFNERLTILTDNPDSPKVQVSLRGKVVGSVRVVPNTVTLGVIKGDTLPTRTIHVSAASGKDFQITGLEATSPLIAAEYTKDETSNRYTVTVTLTAKPPAGAFSEKLRIKTNDPSENLVEIPVYGHMR